LEPERNLLFGSNPGGDSCAQKALDLCTRHSFAFSRANLAQDLGERRKYHGPDFFSVIRMSQQSTYEMIDRAVVVVHVSMPNVEINLGVDEVDIVS